MSIRPLVHKSDQLVSLTDLTRRGTRIFERIKTNSEQFLVMKSSEPIAVVMGISDYESIISELEQLRSATKRQ